MAHFTFRSPDDESRAAERIALRAAQGKPEAALQYYRTWPSHDRTITSAITHHAAFVAARDLKKPDEKLLKSIHESAKICADYERSELDFSRDWAVHTAETAREGRSGNRTDVERSFQEALKAIQEVIRSRHDDEGQDQSQLPVDMLALYKILLLQGGQTGAQYAFDHLNDLRGRQLSHQTQLDVEWWCFVAALLLGRYAEAYAMAHYSLHLRERADPKDIRRGAWRITSIRWIGPYLARAVLWYKLGL